jgi:hypothetical protein
MENKKLDLVNRKELVRLYSLWVGQLQAPEDVGDLRGVQTCLDVLIEQPTVDAVEVVHGQWVKVDIVPNYMWNYRCSCCHSNGESRYNYCPNCGTKMDGDKHE